MSIPPPKWPKIILILFALISINAHAEKLKPHSCTNLFYEDNVQLSGKITERIYAGPPNYESIQNGDIPETVEILQLDKSICVCSKPRDRMNETAVNIDIIQLVKTSIDPIHLKMGRALVKGKLFSAQSGHHRTPVLLEVTVPD